MMLYTDYIKDYKSYEVNEELAVVDNVPWISHIFLPADVLILSILNYQKPYLGNYTKELDKMQWFMNFILVINPLIGLVTNMPRKWNKKAQNENRELSFDELVCQYELSIDYFYGSRLIVKIKVSLLTLASH